MKRFNVIRPFLEGNVPLVEVVKASGVSLRTAKRWVNQYQKAGLVGLANASRRDRGTHRVFSAEVQQSIEGLALRKPPMTAAAIHRKVAQWARQQEQPYPRASVK